MAERTSLAGTPVKTLDVHHSQHCEVCFFHRVGPPNTHTCSKCECGLCNVLCFGKYHTIIHLFYIHNGETGRLLGIRLREQKNNLREGLFSKSTHKSIHSHTLPQWLYCRTITYVDQHMYTTELYVTHTNPTHTSAINRHPQGDINIHNNIYQYNILYIRRHTVVH
jgi:hypothetical protein